MRYATKSVSRRSFVGVGWSALATLAASAKVAASEWTKAEEANVRTIADFCAVWATRDLEKIGAFLAEDCVYRANETAAPTKGRSAIVEQVRGPVTRAEKIQWDVIQTYAIGSIVMDERIDYFISPQRKAAFHCVGVFVLSDGKIREWTDYVIRD